LTDTHARPAATDPETRRHRLDTRRFAALIVDLDGVVTRTARVHTAAWTRLFDAFLAGRTDAGGRPQKLFGRDDYRRYVDGRPRLDGIRTFLAARGLSLREGAPDDPPEAETVHGLARRKNAYFREAIARDGVEVYETSVALLRDARRRGLATAVVSASRNLPVILAATGLSDLFDVRVDGALAAELGLPGKPAPDTFLEAARRLGVPPARAAMAEDALAGVRAGRAGGFGLVVGVARGDTDPASLQAAGADIVVADLAELDLSDAEAALPIPIDRLPGALDHPDVFDPRRTGRRPAVFLDYDGTLTPIVARPDLAVMDDDMRATVRRLAERVPVGVISGRDVADLRAKIGLDGIAYAGSHGFDIHTADDRRVDAADVGDALPVLDAAEAELRRALAGVDGALVERKAFSCAVHYRNVAADAVPAIEAAVARAVEVRPALKRFGGKKVFEIQPAVDWHKGKAVDALLAALDLAEDAVLPIFIGDDVTDENAFRTLAGRGVGIVVGVGGVGVGGGDGSRGEEARETAADYAVPDVPAVRRLLERLADLCEAVDAP